MRPRFFWHACHPSALLAFPPPIANDPSGLVTTTPMLTPLLVLSAYSQGIFPWSDHPVRWYAPPCRAIFNCQDVHLPRNLRKLARKAKFSLSCDQAFTQVMQHCAKAHAQQGTWITQQFIGTYSQLFAMGFAHSVEVWQEGTLVGGLYGLQLGRYFAGESMFHQRANAAKVALAVVVKHLPSLEINWFDSQVLNDFTARCGAFAIDRIAFEQRLQQALPEFLLASEAWPTVIGLEELEG